MKTIIYYLLIVLGLFMTSCTENERDVPAIISEPEEDSIQWTPVPLRDLVPTHVPKANTFAMNLFKRRIAEDQKNPVLAPVSVFACLAMAANGDSGPSRDEILGILGYEPGKLSELNIFCNALLTEGKRLNSPSQCDFANSFWYSSAVTPIESYLHSLRGIFECEVYPLGLDTWDGVNALNSYVESHTRGMIKKLMAEPADITMGLVNVTYFKGMWKKAFNPENTEKGIFRNLDGSDVNTEFMYRENDIEYAHTDNLSAVRLDYAGDAYSMILIQPANNEDFLGMVGDLTADAIQDLDKKYTKVDRILAVPKFEVEYKAALLDDLKEMGMKTSCERGFDKMAADGNHVVTMVRHAVKIIVDEDGTEAAGATIVGMDNAIPQYISFNRPFLYLIRDNGSGTILFMGAITKF